MTWRVAKSLDKLLAEYNARFPNRSKASDGSIGDAAHATRDSDHNPWVKDGTTGIVTARDFTDDDAPGVPEIADFLVATIVARRDKRVKYVIHERRIWRSYAKPGIPAWTPAEYTGTNAHLKHAHVSVKPDKALYDSTAAWGLYPVRTVPPWFTDTRHYYNGPDIDRVRVKLGLPPHLGFDHALAVAVLAFRDKHGLSHETVIDKAFAIKLGA